MLSYDRIAWDLQRRPRQLCNVRLFQFAIQQAKSFGCISTPAVTQRPDLWLDTEISSVILNFFFTFPEE
jgi:hypothetical protein